MPEIGGLPEIVTTPLGPEQLIECLLFVADGPVPVSQLAQALDVPTREAEAALASLEAAFERRGLRLQYWQDKVQLTTAPAAAGAIERFLGLSATTRLSHAALETLAIVAYQQPVTRPQIEAVRGVNSDSVIKSLLSKGLVEEMGRSEGVGRPILYQTTPEFLQHFGLSSLGELPPLNLQEALAQALVVETLAAMGGANGTDGDLVVGVVEAAAPIAPLEGGQDIQLPPAESWAAETPGWPDVQPAPDLPEAEAAPAEPELPPPPPAEPEPQSPAPAHPEPDSEPPRQPWQGDWAPVEADQGPGDAPSTE